MLTQSKLLLLFALLPWAAFCQNLVPNGSFERRFCGSPYISAFRFCDWIRPPGDMNTPDGFVDSGVGTSFNCFPCDCAPGEHTMLGNTYAYAGSAFVGVLGYYIQGGQTNGREYIHAQLMRPLVAGRTYQI